MTDNPLLESFFIAGLECSTHRRRDGVRLDLLDASGHARLAYQDFCRLKRLGMGAARSGLRWHRTERLDGTLDFSADLPLLEAARDARVQVVWDLCHYGYPDFLDPLSPKFVEHFARYARAAAEVIQDHSPGGEVWVCPVNEISFWAWAGGVGYFNPFCAGQADALKRQLVRAAIAAIEAVWEVAPGARVVHADPVIHIAPKSANLGDVAAAENHRQAQYQAWDMLCGRMYPDLGGRPDYLDVLGLNYYPSNQWTLDGPRLTPRDPGYRPLRELLREVYWRYGRPLFIAETGTEAEARPDWLRFVCDEVAAAHALGVPVGGVCWYPILNHPGWDDGRHCHNGLFDYVDASGGREVHAPLAKELARQQERFVGVAS